MRLTHPRIHERSSDGEAKANTEPVPCISLGPDGSIVDANPAASLLLNVTPRHIVGRAFPMFLCAERPRFLYTMVNVLGTGTSARLQVSIRPRDRAPFNAMLEIRREPSEQLRLIIERLEPVTTAETSGHKAVLSAA